MAYPYNLRLYTNILSSSWPRLVADLTPYALGWTRSIRAVGGFWQGSFTMAGNQRNLQQAFDTWLGYHIEEKTGGVITWEGMVYELELSRGGVRRRRTLDLMYNAVKTSYTTIDWTDNLIENGGFETAGGTATFDSWPEGADPSNVEDETVIVQADSHSCKITGDNLSDDVGGVTVPHQTAYQDVITTIGTGYRLTVYGYGDAKIGVRTIGVNPVWLVSPTDMGTGTAWGQRTYYFAGPGSGRVRVHLYPSRQDQVGYFDSVAVEQRGETVSETDWLMLDALGAPTSEASQSHSITRYGRREEMIFLDDYPQATADAMRSTFLAENNYPWARPVSVGEDYDTILTVHCAGYCHTANWQFVLEGDGLEHNLNDWIASIVGSDFGLSPQHGGTVATAGDCQYLKTARIVTNTLQVTQKSTIDQRAWDVLSELQEVGIDGSEGEPTYMPTRIWVTVGRWFNYDKIDREPRYYLRHDGLYDRSGKRMSRTPWAIQPGVVRDMSYPASRDLPGSFLDDPRDFWVEEVDVDADGKVLLKTSLFSEYDALSAEYRLEGTGEVVDPTISGRPQLTSSGSGGAAPPPPPPPAPGPSERRKPRR